VINVRIAIVMVLVGICLWVAQGVSVAEDIKEQMKARLPTIVDLKARGLVGENNKGYLELRSAAREQEDVVAAENRDRSQVYSAIAAQEGTTEQLVGERRAAQIGQKAAPGEWIQDSSGTWYQKQ
jgi:uncharacterized protein YdbL (DUF1318 family)